VNSSFNKAIKFNIYETSTSPSAGIVALEGSETIAENIYPKVKIKTAKPRALRVK
jgi:hypothetical protein